MKIVGIDYGSKLAGTTALMYLDGKQIHFWQSKKNENADEFLLELINSIQPTTIFIDAPLSLPGVYFDNVNYSNYFYRASDKELNGMSPMFLGGLTARAMQLKARLEKEGHQLVEIYPAALARALDLASLKYKKDKIHIEEVQDFLVNQYQDLNIAPLKLTNWHQVDALLALISGWRFYQKIHSVHGDEKEGLIIY